MSNDFMREIVGECGPMKTVMYIGFNLSGIARTWESRSRNINTIATIQGTNTRFGRVNQKGASIYDENNQLVGMAHLSKRRSTFASVRRDRPLLNKLTADITTPYYYGTGILGGGLNSNRPMTCVPIGGVVNVELNCFAKKYFSRSAHPCAFNRLVKSLAHCLNATICCDLTVSRPTVLNCRYEILPRSRCGGGLYELIERLLTGNVQLLTGVDPAALTVTLNDTNQFVVRSGNDFEVIADEVVYNLDPADMAMVRAQMTQQSIANPDLATHQSSFLVDIGTDAICSVLGPDIRCCTPDPDGSIFTVGFAASGGENSIGDPCMSGTVSVFTRFNPFELLPRTGIIPDSGNFNCTRQVLVHVEMTDTSYKTALTAVNGDTTTVGTPVASTNEYIASIRRAAGVVRCVRQAFGVDTLTLAQIVEEIRQPNVNGTFNVETRLNNTPYISGASYNWIHEVNDYFGLELFADNALSRAEVPRVDLTRFGR